MDTGSSSPGSSPGRRTLCCVLGKDFTVTVLLSTQVYTEMGNSELNAGGNPAMD